MATFLGAKGEKLSLPLGSSADPSSPPHSEMFLRPKLHKIWLRSVELMSTSWMVKLSMARAPSPRGLLAFSLPWNQHLERRRSTRRRGGRGGRGGRGAGPRVVDVDQKQRKTETGVLERRFCPSLRALPRRCAALCRRCSADMWTSIFARSHRLLHAPTHTHTHTFFILMVACNGSVPGGPFFCYFFFVFAPEKNSFL